MKRLILFGVLLGMFFSMAMAQESLRKDRLFKVDPLSGLFKEFRVSYEQRLLGEFWWYVSPHLYHQTWLPKRNERLGRPENPQKYYGMGMRFGGRKYFSGKSPIGLYINVMGIYRHTWINQLNTDLSLNVRERFHSIGLGAMVGWQNLFSPRKWTSPKHVNMTYGFMAGLEYFRNFGPEYDVDRFVQNWYEYPFTWKPDFLNGFRLYLGIELGIAFKQRNRHW